MSGVKCTSKRIAACILSVFMSCLVLSGCSHRIEGEVSVLPYPVYEPMSPQTSRTKSSSISGFAEDLCVLGRDNTSTANTDVQTCNAALLFNLDKLGTPFAYNVFDRVYPASTTKIMTLLVAAEEGNPEDEVIVSETAAGQPSDSSVCGLLPGDKMTLKDLMYGMMLRSGNDAAAAIAEHVGGSEAGFAELMNKKAHSLGATGSHFTNPHGYHDEEHYTTAYDMYLILNEAIKNDLFMDIFTASSQEVTYHDAAGEEKTVTWSSTNQYKTGAETAPDGYTVLGGKTGTTYDAGYCLVLLVENPEGEKEVVSVFKSDAKINLYLVMNQLMRFYGDIEEEPEAETEAEAEPETEAPADTEMGTEVGTEAGTETETETETETI